ncbi:MAG TPA: YtcA family lipoprotein [Bryobacteraceae bacterium]|jgi:YtcA family|nr:YtcA family lipoprotein [Bryobacteraceae bacterium]
MKTALVLASLLLTSCSRAPSFDIVGSFFPAWLVCLVMAIVFSALSGWLLRLLNIPVAVPTLTYSGLTALFTFALWLIFFGS